MRTLKIGVIGYSGQKFNEHDANEMLAAAFNVVLADHPEATDIWVVSSLADLGIPALAYRAAVARGWKTFAVDCARSAKYTAFPVDRRTIIDSMERGSESEAFLAECDVIVRIGGGKQSLAEVKTFSENGGRTYEHELAAS